MTVSELIRELSQFPFDADVMVDISDSGNVKDFARFVASDYGDEGALHATLTLVLNLALSD